MIKMIRLKNDPQFRVNGVKYDLTDYSPEQLQKVYDTNPQLQHLFEFIIEEVIEEVIEFVEEKVENFIKKHKK